MCRSFAVLLLLCAACLGRPAGAQPDRTEALAKAKAKFEADVSKAEDALLANIDKALKNAAGNKATTEKLTYERELFVSQRIVPTAVPAGTYLKQRSQATAALEAVYLPAIKELVKAKKDDEAAALEGALGDLLKTARGYGLGLPDLEAARPMFVIESKATGLVIEPVGKDGLGELGLATKMGKKKPAQCWNLERDEKGFVVRGAQSGRAFSISYRVSPDGGPLVSHLATAKLDPLKEVPDRSLFRLGETRREVTIASLSKDKTDYVVTAIERKLKGVTVYDLVLEKKETPPTPGQLWVFAEAK
jgi:hypothetical protein